MPLVQIGILLFSFLRDVHLSNNMSDRSNENKVTQKIQGEVSDQLGLSTVMNAKATLGWIWEMRLKGIIIESTHSTLGFFSEQCGGEKG